MSFLPASKFQSLLLCFILFLSCSSDKEQRPLNILWIIGEDLGPEMAVYGRQHIRTPNIDRLAREGVLFKTAFSTAPVCSPSRSAFMTGMYQTSIGAHNHRSHRDDGFILGDSVKVITDWFRQAGIFTSNIRQLSEDPEEKFYRGTGKTDWNFNYEGPAFDGDTWSELKSEQPFYAQINFSETHRGRTWNTAHDYLDWTADPDSVTFPPYYPDDPVIRREWATYHNAIMALDKKVGFVLAKLEEDGLDENTLVVFMGDHGRAMLRGKQFPYDSGLNVPLIMRWPDGRRAGSVDTRLVALIDVSATSLNQAGIEKPQAMQGRILFGKDREEDRTMVFGGRDRGDESVFRMRTVRTDRFRYIYNFMPEVPLLSLNRYKEATYPILKRMRELHDRNELSSVQSALFAPQMPVEELYDIKNDPFEIENLAASPSMMEIKEELRSELKAWIERSNDQGIFLESKEIHDFWERTLKENYTERLTELYGDPLPEFLRGSRP